MLLPLVDGAYISIVLSGGLREVSNAVAVGCFLLCGGASLSLATTISGNKLTRVKKTVSIGLLVTLACILVTMVSPILEEIIRFNVFKNFAGISIILISINTLSKGLGNKIPSPSIILLIGALGSLDIQGTSILVNLNLQLLLNSVISGLTATLLISISAVLVPQKAVKLIKYPCSLFLVLIAFKVLGIF
ncbi:MAG: putative membrane protein [Candidatus Methanohalarchaeum thermophilum]|uniref:Membrane protein n=1 Tax=Methanohalarchaeum thermophilum TaxID=1903181 RepID=A0A1Q6DVI7_METT1|nr:MAG: putative membrane protein [Candidatus Methanohalarchaeum thermophilum]